MNGIIQLKYKSIHLESLIVSRNNIRKFIGKYAYIYYTFSGIFKAKGKQNQLRHLWCFVEVGGALLVCFAHCNCLSGGISYTASWVMKF